MDLGTNQHVASSNGAQPAVGEKKKLNRIPRIKRGLKSIRPGQKSSAQKSQDLAIALTLLSATLTGTDDERQKIDELAKQMAEALPDAIRTQCAAIEGKWHLAFTLANPEGLDDDELFSQAFTKFLPVFEASPALQRGFVPAAKPSWKCTKGGVRIDSGFF